MNKKYHSQTRKTQFICRIGVFKNYCNPVQGVDTFSGMVEVPNIMHFHNNWIVLF